MTTTKQKKNSIQGIARIAGALYLLIAILSIPIHFIIPAQLIVAGDAATTANNIMASDGLLRAGIASDSVVFLIEIVVTVLL